MISPDKRNKIAKALQTVFGTDGYESNDQLTRGLSGSIISKMVVKGNPYCLRIIPENATRDNPAHYFDCMKEAATAGIAPEIHYMSIEDGILITDFIAPHLFTVQEAKKQLPEILHRLHNMEKFSRQVNYIETANKFVQRCQTMFQNNTNLKPLFELYTIVTKAYPCFDEENLVSCHNDLKPDNIIFDGVRPWLIDWEAAFVNDRYADLAAIANFIVRNDKEEVEFLESYFQKLPDACQQARFFLMGLILHMFCFSICSVTLNAEQTIDLYGSVCGFEQFHEGLWNATINLGDPKQKLEYGLVHLNEFNRKTQMPRFKQSMQIITGHTIL